MGCDIHMYVEYAADNGHTEYWNTLARRANPGRNYEIFAKLAGVRTDDPSDQIIPTRGLPEKPSLMTKWDNELFVDDEDRSEGTVSSLNANRWVSDGSSAWTDDRKKSVTHPDWHSHSWCSADEFRKVLESVDRWPVGAPYWAILATLDEFERRNHKARLVFWFDN